MTDGNPSPLIPASLVGSALLVLFLLPAGIVFDSALALAQAADSFMDVLAASVLWWTTRVGRNPPDDDHPFGHTRAEPIGGLATAILAALLAVEVGQDAVQILLGERIVDASPWLLVLFVTKFAFRGTIYTLARRYKTPALRALTVDSRNDMLISAVALVGFAGAATGWPALDAWLALPVAGWIGWAGFDLARENIRLLMGEAPAPERQAELERIAEEIEGVLAVRRVRAHYLGTEIAVDLHAVVDRRLSIGKAQEIAIRVRARLEAESDVLHCSVHLDPSESVPREENA